MHLQPIYIPYLQYLQLEVHLEPRTLRWSFFAELVNVLRLLAIFAEEFHRGSLTECLTGSKCDTAQ